MARHCRKDCDPQVDNTGISCDGEFVSEECVVLNQNTYFGIVSGDFLSKLILVLTQRIKSIWVALGRRIDYTALQTFLDDAEASTGGVAIGKPYKTVDGFVKIRVS